MAKIQISFQDNADNEDKFKIYRGTASPVTVSDNLIAEITWNQTAGEWQVSGSASNAQITQGVNVDPSSSGQTYIMIYDETTPDTYYYGVSASNAVGDSAISTSGSVTVNA